MIAQIPVATRDDPVVAICLELQHAIRPHLVTRDVMSKLADAGRLVPPAGTV